MSTRTKGVNMPHIERRSMKRLQYHQYGGPGTMRLEDFELEDPGKGQVAVKVRFAAINPIDWKPVSYTHLTLPTNREV